MEEQDIVDVEETEDSYIIEFRKAEVEEPDAETEEVAEEVEAVVEKLLQPRGPSRRVLPGRWHLRCPLLTKRSARFAWLSQAKNRLCAHSAWKC